jgi:hypothetical protein
MSEPVTDRLTRVYRGDGFRFAYPAGAHVEHDVDQRTLESAVLTDHEEPLLIAVAVEESPLATRALQVPGLLGALVSKYRDKGGYEELWFGAVPVDGSDSAEAAELRYGAGDPRHALIVAARIAGPEIVTVQVHFPPSTAEENRPLALGIVESLTVDPDAIGPVSTGDRWDVIHPDAAFPPGDDP